MKLARLGLGYRMETKLEGPGIGTNFVVFLYGQGENDLGGRCVGFCGSGFLRRSTTLAGGVAGRRLRCLFFAVFALSFNGPSDFH